MTPFPFHKLAYCGSLQISSFLSTLADGERVTVSWFWFSAKATYRVRPSIWQVYLSDTLQYWKTHYLLTSSGQRNCTRSAKRGGK